VIVSELPDSDARLVIPGSVGDEGVVVRASGTVDLGGNGGVLSDTGWSAISTYSGPEIDYQYLASRMGVTSSTTNSWVGIVSTSREQGKIFIILIQPPVPWI